MWALEKKTLKYFIMAILNNITKIYDNCILFNKVRYIDEH